MYICKENIFFMKTIKINESDLKNIVKKTVKKIYENYQLHDVDELMEFMWLKPNITQLNVDIFVDDGGSYLRNNHDLLVFVRNGYTKDVSEFIPFLVSQTPVILDKNLNYNITYNDIFAVQDFIKTNVNVLFKLANEEISHDEFINQIKVPYYSISENKNIILEMATLRTKDSNLPMDIWLDEGATYIGHAPRIKFIASHEQKTTREFSSMILTNPPTIENFPDNSLIKAKDLNKLKIFVINNLDLLLKLSKGEIDYRTEFLPNMIII